MYVCNEIMSRLKITLRSQIALDVTKLKLDRFLNHDMNLDFQNRDVPHSCEEQMCSAQASGINMKVPCEMLI